jgi:aminomethyltransferase
LRVADGAREAGQAGRSRAVEVRIGRTGYTGEPLCFELFVAAEDAPALWDALVAAGAEPVGLGARDTLRLEAGLPLYGHELGLDPEGNEIPVMSCPLASFAVSLSPRKGDYVGRAALARQHRAYGRILVRDWSLVEDLPNMTRPVAITGRGIAREGAEVYRDGERVGWITSGTAVPYWGVEGEGLCSLQTQEHHLRSIALAYVDSRIVEDDEVEVDVRGKRVPGLVVPYHLRSDAPPCARAIVWDYVPELPALKGGASGEKALRLIGQAIENHEWRQRRCIDLIPSEMTASPLARLLSVTDPAFRYAEHKKTEAFYDMEVFYYQGTGFIHEVERLLVQELRAYLGCAEVETRVISGQMANAAVFSALVDYLNRGDRKAEPRRIAKVINNHIGKGGHLSAQPMGALKDYVAREPRTESPAVVDIPVLSENPYHADVPALLDLIEKERPELIILGKSMVLHPEPVYEVRAFLDEIGSRAVLMYDMAHVLGLAGPHFQEPFVEGADIVTGSTHKTFFGTQRGIVGGRWREPDEKWELWEAIERRAFPGSVSNHHLGTLLGLLLAAYEMNHFKDAYQQAVIANAKSFARALKDAGLDVAGDASVDFTETHQVIVNVGYGMGADVAGRLEASNIICNYQATPDEEGFTAAGGLRLGVSEMTRFGMGADDFREVAELMAAVVLRGANVADDVAALRSRFTELGYTFTGDAFAPLVEKLHGLI